MNNLNRHNDPDEDKDIFAKVILCIIGLMFLALICVQYGIAKGRQMERAEFYDEADKAPIAADGELRVTCPPSQKGKAHHERNSHKYH